jgi:hypothetical protein
MHPGNRVLSVKYAYFVKQSEVQKRNGLFCANFIFKMQQYPKYDLSANDGFDVIEFVSKGIKGDIDKIIVIEPTYNPQVFNLGFCDKVKVIRNNEIFFEFDYRVNSENGDRDVVLATIAGAASDYTLK